MGDSPVSVCQNQTMSDKFRSGIILFKHSIERPFSRMHDWIIRKLGGVPACFNNNLVRHAENEMQLCWPESDHMQDMIKSSIRDVVAVFSKEGHSGSSASYAIPYIKELLNYGILLPLTGADDEWGEAMDDKGTQQNKRLSSVLKSKDKPAHYLNAIVFQGENYSFTGSVDGISSSQQTTFPFLPRKFYIDVKRELYDPEKHGEDACVNACGTGNYVYCIKDRGQLQEVWKHYIKPAGV